MLNQPVLRAIWTSLLCDIIISPLCLCFCLATALTSIRINVSSWTESSKKVTINWRPLKFPTMNIHCSGATSCHRLASVRSSTLAAGHRLLCALNHHKLLSGFAILTRYIVGHCWVNCVTANNSPRLWWFSIVLWWKTMRQSSVWGVTVFCFCFNGKLKWN